MSATYNVVSIEGNEYEVYADLATADLYLAAEPTATTYRAELDDDVKGRWAVSATRILDRQPWPGSKTDEAQTLAFPRDGDTAVPQVIIDAACELINALANGWDAANKSTTANTVKRQKAGSVEIEYFRGAEGTGLRLPLPVWELIGPLLDSGIGAGALSFGTSGESAFETGFDRSQPI